MFANEVGRESGRGQPGTHCPTFGRVGGDRGHTDGCAGGVCADKFMLTARLEGFGEDGITVMVVEDHEVFAAPDWK